MSLRQVGWFDLATFDLEDYEEWDHPQVTRKLRFSTGFLLKPITHRELNVLDSTVIPFRDSKFDAKDSYTSILLLCR